MYILFLAKKKCLLIDKGRAQLHSMWNSIRFTLESNYIILFYYVFVFFRLACIMGKVLTSNSIFMVCQDKRQIHTYIYIYIVKHVHLIVGRDAHIYSI